MHDVFLIAAKRTPIGAFLGQFKDISATELGAVAMSAALRDAKVDVASVDEVIMGNVLSAGLGQAPARQAALAAGLPDSVPATTVNKVCGSGLQSVLLASRALALGDAQIAVAGGMESMSRVPHYLRSSRQGTRLGSTELVDGMVHDGLWDPYNDFHMGSAAELCVRESGFSREEQDRYAAESYRRALMARAEGHFQAEMASVSVPQKRAEPLVVDTDEEPARGRPERLASLRPAFDPEGTVTAGNASTLNDGAAAVVLANREAVEGHGLQPLARIVASGVAAQAPAWFTTAPVPAVRKALERAQLSTRDVDLWEINEAFSCVTMACSQQLELDASRVNVSGGAVALGHPIGATGTRLLTTLVHGLIRRRERRGVASLCIGGGEGIALLIERV